MGQRDTITLTHAVTRRGPLAHTVKRDNGRLFERRWKKGTRSVGFVMVRKYVASPILISESDVHSAW